MSERIHKVLAQHGIGSRREVERWIGERRIQINGVIAKTGDRYEVGDRVQLDGRDVSKRLEHQVVAQVIAYHKPQGQPIERPVNQGDEQVVEESAEERLPVHRGARWVAINPMHPGDSGLLLFTNDGALSYALTRQKKKIPTTYMVRVHVRGGVSAAPVIATTLRLDDETIEFSEVTVSNTQSAQGDIDQGESEAGNIWYKVVLPRADKRAAVRALFVSNNLTVSRMMQVAFGDIALTKEMPRARSVPLKPVQLQSLYALAQIKIPDQMQRNSMRRGEQDSPDDRDAKEDSVAPRNYTAQQARAATRVPRASRAQANSQKEADSPNSRKAGPGATQRAALRRGISGGSNRPSRPGPRSSKR